MLVVCPRCGGRAVAREVEAHEARLTCTGCGLRSDWRGDRLHALLGGRAVVLTRARHAWVAPATGHGVHEPVVREGADPRFGVPLWLRAQCCGGKLLWANNEAHLDYLEAYVGARLRDHAPGPAPLSARLPGWMKAAKNRAEVLRHLQRLRHTLG